MRKAKIKMKYAEALEYLHNMPSRGSLRTGIINELLKTLSDPEKRLKVIQISGNRGKSSVISMLSAVLTEHGRKCGSFISPAVFEFREQFQINGKAISKAEFGKYAERIIKAAEGTEGEGPASLRLSEFEFLLACLWFAEKNSELVVWETTRENQVVFSENILFPIMQADTDNQLFSHKATAVHHGLEKQRFNYGNCKNLVIPLAGTFQIHNCICALETLLALERIQAKCNSPFILKEEKIRSGLMKATCPGRCRLLRKKPYLLTDNASDTESVKQLHKTLQICFTNSRIIYIIGMLGDGETDRILPLISSNAAAVITTSRPGDKNYISPLALAEKLSQYTPNVTAADSPEEAIELAMLLAGPADAVVTIAPLPLLGRVINTVENNTDNKDTHGI